MYGKVNNHMFLSKTPNACSSKTRDTKFPGPGSQFSFQPNQSKDNISTDDDIRPHTA